LNKTWEPKKKGRDHLFVVVLAVLAFELKVLTPIYHIPILTAEIKNDENANGSKDTEKQNVSCNEKRAMEM
jgi:hypothetical protein